MVNESKSKRKKRGGSQWWSTACAIQEGKGPTKWTLTCKELNTKIYDSIWHIERHPSFLDNTYQHHKHAICHLSFNLYYSAYVYRGIYFIIYTVYILYSYIYLYIYYNPYENISKIFEVNKLNLKFMWKKQTKQKVKREKPWNMQLYGHQQAYPDTEIYTKASVIERLWYSTWIERWSSRKKIESSEEKAQVHIKF